MPRRQVFLGQKLGQNWGKSPRGAAARRFAMPSGPLKMDVLQAPRMRSVRGNRVFPAEDMRYQ